MEKGFVGTAVVCWSGRKVVEAERGLHRGGLAGTRALLKAVALTPEEGRPDGEYWRVRIGGTPL